MSSAAHASKVTDHHGLILDLVYFNDPAIVARLGCPVGGNEVGWPQCMQRRFFVVTALCMQNKKMLLVLSHIAMMSTTGAA